MRRKTIGAVLVLAVAGGFPGWGQSDQGGLAGPVLEVGASGQAALTREERFTLKAQAAGRVHARGEVPVLPFADLGLGLEAHGTLGSSLEGGWQYRGHLGGALEVLARLRFPLAVTAGGRRLYLGGATGVSFNVDRYTFTQLYFYYPGWFLEPQLELQLRPGGRSGLGIVLPIDVYFRKDLEVSTAFGLGIAWRLYRKENR